MTDWSRFRKCPVCHAAIGRPCCSLTGVAPRGAIPGNAPLDQPHSRRQLRTGGV